MEDYRGKWLDQPQTILFAVTDAVATITLNRPEKRNALGGEMLADLHAAMLEADDRTDVNCIVLAGAGKDFCAGYDLVGAYAGNAEDGSAQHSYRSTNATLDDDSWALERSQALSTIMFDLHKPVIAKVQGNCLAGGTDLAFGCDLVIASNEAKIGFPATRANGCSAAKAGVIHMTRYVAAAYARHHIRVNAVSPGLVRTRAVEAFMTPEQQTSFAAAVQPIGRIIEPGEVADALFGCVRTRRRW